MTRRAVFKQADLTRALRGAKAAGLQPRGCKINLATGEIEMDFGAGLKQVPTEFDAWKAKRDAREA